MMSWSCGLGRESVFTNQGVGHMKRRKFIQTVSVGLPGIAASVRQNSAASQLSRFRRRVQSTRDEREFWKTVRSEFRLGEDFTHLNCGSIGASPRMVSDTLVQALSAIDINPYSNIFGDGLNQQLGAVREKCARFVRAESDEIALIRNTTEGMNLISRGLGLKAGDEVLTSNREHPGGMSCWQFLAKQRGIKIICLELPCPMQDPLEIINLVRKKTTARTKAYSFSHVDTITGDVLPIEALAAEAKEKGIFFICDGAQAVGMIDTDVIQLGVDAYVASCHKWMLGPKGTGMLYLKRASQQRIQSMELSTGFQVYTASFGTRDVAKILAQGTSVEFLLAIGRQKIEARLRDLNRVLSDGLSGIAALRRLTSEGQKRSCGISTYSVDRKVVDAFALTKQLEKDFRIYIKPSQATYSMVPDPARKPENYNSIRISTHVFNSKEQIDRLIAVLSKLLS